MPDMRCQSRRSPPLHGGNNKSCWSQTPRPIAHSAEPPWCTQGSGAVVINLAEERRLQPLLLVRELCELQLTVTRSLLLLELLLLSLLRPFLATLNGILRQR